MFSSKRGRKSNDIACIFVHAGAGYHSVQNENVHLQACNDAAKSAMAALKAGGSAVDAVELAVKVLEDREITNAGYGSNLAIDGVVECDAVVVNHNGRSGGVGAVAQIQNPVSLARLLLDHANQPLSLRRVPPNFLAGKGATDFASEHGMPILPPNYLISPAARQRWTKWRDDLERAECNRRREDEEPSSFSPIPSQTDMIQYQDHDTEVEQARKAHMQAIKAGVWNEAQPISPTPSDNLNARNDSLSTSNSNSASSMDISQITSDTTPDSRFEYTDPCGPPGMLFNNSRYAFGNSTHKMPTPPSPGLMRSNRSNDREYASQQHFGSEMEFSDVNDEQDRAPPIHMRQQHQLVGWDDGSSGSDSDSTTVARNRHSLRQSPVHIDGGRLGHATLFPFPDSTCDKDGESMSRSTELLDQIQSGSHPANDGSDGDEDLITDTVGAIAIDLYGNIACAASSGGIGMKHRGRIGPAATVSTGAAVLPPDKDDPEHVTVATVTSGTGEHMSTTSAALVCSERVYQSFRKIPGGGYEECNEDESIRRFIEKDFMGHPSVEQSHSTGAIGVLSVKRTKDGAYLYYGHNTDSFALASMHSNEVTPVCTMSRSKGHGVIAQGGRAIRNGKRKR